MPDDKPMATLESIAAQLTTVAAKVNAMDARFDAMDARFDAMDARFDAMDAKIDRSEAETRAQLGVKIEAVGEDVKRVYDAVLALQDHHEANVKAHVVFTSRLEDHDLRILALEHPKPAKR